MEESLTGKTIIIGITGSIAAYKGADLVSRLRKLDATIHVVLTEGGSKFITPLTLQALSRNPVAANLWDEGNGWQPGHIDLADRADLLVVAPATADVIARFAQGLAPDFLCSLYLACLSPVLIAPAMNGKMYQHPATQANIRTLKERGNTFIGPEEGMLACGYEGIGRLWPVEKIVERIVEMLSPN